MTSLREQLTGVATPLPRFGILLPSGWESMAPTRETFRSLIAEASARFRAAGRPDLDAQLRTMVESAASQFLARDPVAIYLQRSVPEDEVLPVSITAARVTGPDGRSLDGWVTELVSRHGAEPYGGGRTMMRWVVDTRPRTQGQAVPIRSVNYLIPVPETGRRQGLLFTAVIPVGSAPPLDPELVDRIVMLSDVIMSTFQWRREG